MRFMGGKGLLDHKGRQRWKDRRSGAEGMGQIDHMGKTEGLRRLAGARAIDNRPAAGAINGLLDKTGGAQQIKEFGWTHGLNFLGTWVIRSLDDSVIG